MAENLNFWPPRNKDICRESQKHHNSDENKDYSYANVANKLPKGAMKNIAEECGVSTKTVQRVWKLKLDVERNGSILDLESKVKANSGIKVFNLNSY